MSGPCATSISFRTYRVPPVRACPLLALGGAELFPIIEPLLDLALEAALERLVKALPRQADGEIVESREAVLRVGIVDIAFAVAEIAHQLRRRVERVLGRHQ